MATRLAVLNLLIERMRIAVPEGQSGCHKSTAIFARDHEPMIAAVCAALAPYVEPLRFRFQEHPIVSRNRVMITTWEPKPQPWEDGA